MPHPVVIAIVEGF